MHKIQFFVNRGPTGYATGDNVGTKNVRLPITYPMILVWFQLDHKYLSYSEKASGSIFGASRGVEAKYFLGPRLKIFVFIRGTQKAP